MIRFYYIITFSIVILQTFLFLPSNAIENGTTAISTTTTTTTTTTPKTTTTTSLINPKSCDCLNGGTCSSDNQICNCKSDFYGTQCEFVKCDAQNDTLYLSQCRNGHCLRNTQTKQYQCKCYPSHYGALCERPICLDYCYNGGGCNDNLGNEYKFDINTNATANLSCSCSSLERFYGKRCEFDKCYKEVETCDKTCYLDNECKCRCTKECDEVYCNKRGSCLNNANGNLVCACSIGYSGIRCTIDNCSGYCFNNGTCQKDNQTFYCVCPSGYNGTRCDNKINKQDESSSTSVPNKSGRSSVQFLIYGLTVTIIICLCLIGIYYSFQRGYFDNINLNIFNRIRILGGQGSSSGAGTTSGPFTRTNLIFNKLEDEQNIVQNEV